MFVVQKTYLLCFDLESTVDFYRALLKRDGVRLGRNEYSFDLVGTWLSCVRLGGHEHTPAPLAIVLGAAKLPTAREIELAGGRVLTDFPFTVPAGETIVAADPGGNVVCFKLVTDHV